MEGVQTISIPLAMLAGVLSFLSPCVLPLVPAYIGYMTGQAANTASNSLVAASAGGAIAAEAQPNRWLIFLHGLFFVLGFSLVFILVFGFGTGLLGYVSIQFVGVRDTISRIGGVLVIVMGLHVMGVIRIPFLYYDTREQSAPRKDLGFLGSTLMGVTFAAGWSPCIGPILSSITTLSLQSGSVDGSTALLGAYALGLGIPFLVAALLLDRATVQIRKFQKHMHTIELVSGGLMIVIGLIILFGGLQALASNLSGFTGLTTSLDNWLLSLSGSAQ